MLPEQTAAKWEHSLCRILGWRFKSWPANAPAVRFLNRRPKSSWFGCITIQPLLAVTKIFHGAVVKEEGQPPPPLLRSNASLDTGPWTRGALLFQKDVPWFTGRTQSSCSRTHMNASWGCQQHKGGVILCSCRSAVCCTCHVLSVNPPPSPSPTHWGSLGCRLGGPGVQGGLLRRL